jgi:hypothetical protein
LAPAAWQASYSLFFIGREALTMSGNSLPTPLQNSLIPAPVPVDSTMTLVPAFARWNSSATARVNG